MDFRYRRFSPIQAPSEAHFRGCRPFDASQIATAAVEQHRLLVNQQHLKQIWNTAGVVDGKDWMEWLKRLARELMRESPSQALRACCGLAEQHAPFGAELFNVAFVSCWTELYETYQVSSRGGATLSYAHVYTTGGPCCPGIERHTVTHGPGRSSRRPADSCRVYGTRRETSAN